MPRLGSVFYARDQSDCGIHCDDRRAAVAEKRKRYADNRRYADAHAYVNKGLERKRRCNAEADEHSERAARAHADDAAADDDYAKQNDDDYAGDHAKLLAYRGKDTVCVPCVIAALREAALAEAHARPAAGGKRLLAQICLPRYALTRGIDHVGNIRREDAFFLIIAKEEVPEQRGHCRNDSRCRSHPVPRDACADEHDHENSEEYKRAAQVVGDNGYKTEIQCPVNAELQNRREFVERALLFICRHLFCDKDDEYDLNDLRRLNADAGKTIPCARADLVALAEEDESDDEKNVEYRKIHPLVGDKIGVDDREHDECANAEEHCKALNDDVFCPAVGACHTVDHDYAEDRAYHADSEKKNIRPFEKVFNFSGIDFNRRRRPSKMPDFTNNRSLMRYILAYYCPLRNEVSCGIIQIQKKFKK